MNRLKTSNNVKGFFFSGRRELICATDQCLVFVGMTLVGPVRHGPVDTENKIMDNVVLWIQKLMCRVVWCCG